MSDKAANVTGRPRQGRLVAAGIAARELGVARRTVVRWIRRGVLRGRRVGGRWYAYRDAVNAVAGTLG